MFTALQEHELEVFYDRNEQNRILAEDVEEYLSPIYYSDAQLVICILGPDYPKRIWTKIESDQFKLRFKSGEVIPIVLNTAQLGMFDSAARVGHISWDRTKTIAEQLPAVIEMLIGKCSELRKGLKGKTEQPYAPVQQ